MNIYYERHSDHAVVIIEGDIEGYQQELFKRPFSELVLIGCYSIILDLTKVRMLSSLIMGTIIEYWRICLEAGGNFIILNPTGRVRELFEITNIMSRISVIENIFEARALLRKGSRT